MQSLQLAREQKASSWELRAVTSLSQHWHHQTRTEKLRNSCLRSTVNEGFETIDRKTAQLIEKFRTSLTARRKLRLAASRAA
jgi:hypothetical protein